MHLHGAVAFHDFLCAEVLLLGCDDLIRPAYRKENHDSARKESVVGHQAGGVVNGVASQTGNAEHCQNPGDDHDRGFSLRKGFIPAVGEHEPGQAVTSDEAGHGGDRRCHEGEWRLECCDGGGGDADDGQSDDKRH